MRSAVALLVLATAAAHASPNVSLDDPVYDDLARLQALGVIGLYQGGVSPLTEDRVRELLGLPAPADERGWWVRPISEGDWRVIAFREDDEPYSTAASPRDLRGFLGLSCENFDGRPCGHGEGFEGELATAAGYGQLAAIDVWLRPRAGTTLYGNGLDVERAYANVALGPALVEVGRDQLEIGPRAHTELAWGENAAPLDQIRIQTARPYPLTDELRGNVLWAIGRINDSTQQSPPIASIARVQLDIASRVEVGLHQELLMGGDGAPSFGVLDFLAEQVRRANASAGTADSSNRRFGGDVTVHVHGARIYYSLVFEDIRKHVIDAIHYDADQLLGVELAALGGKHGLVVELARIGVRSYTHVPERTEFENGGEIVGAPFGPDAQSLYASGRIELADITLLPWAQIIRRSDDTYDFVTNGPILHETSGTPEWHYRLAARARWPMTPQLRGEAELVYEHVSSLEYTSTASANNVGMMLAFIWQPGGFWPRPR